MKKILMPFASACLFVSIGNVGAQQAPTFSSFQVQTNKELRLRLAGPTSFTYRFDAGDDLSSWVPLISLTNTTGTVEHIDTATPFLSGRFYRAEQLSGTVFTGDYLRTDDGDVIIHPVFHATIMLSWKDKIICVDPYSNVQAQLLALPRADLVLVTHEHGDHYNSTTISAVMKPGAALLVSRSVYSVLPSNLKSIATQMTNGAVAEVTGVGVKAVPAYNANHPKGNGNGYVLTIGGKNLYITGDTDDVPEMRALRNIDVAFVVMDGQFNMSMTRAASAVREFRPKVVFPYHYNTQNPATFKQLVGTDLGIEVRLRKWQ